MQWQIGLHENRHKLLTLPAGQSALDRYWIADLSLLISTELEWSSFSGPCIPYRMLNTVVSYTSTFVALLIATFFNILVNCLTVSHASPILLQITGREELLLQIKPPRQINSSTWSTAWPSMLISQGRAAFRWADDLLYRCWYSYQSVYSPLQSSVCYCRLSLCYQWSVDCSIYMRLYPLITTPISRLCSALTSTTSWTILYYM